MSHQLYMVCAVAEECFRWHNLAPYAVYSSHPAWGAFVFIEPRPRVHELAWTRSTLAEMAARRDTQHTVHWDVCTSGKNIDVAHHNGNLSNRYTLPRWNLTEGLFQMVRDEAPLFWWYFDGVAVIERRP